MLRHGMTNSPLHKIWMGMNKRCNTPSYQHYNRYGGRGIKVCKRWKMFENFYYDMAGTYEEGLTLERKNNNSDYSRSNCRWVTIKEQQNNRSSNIYYTINGKSKTLSQWCDSYGISYQRVYARINKGKWDLLEALTVGKYNKYKKQ